MFSTQLPPEGAKTVWEDRCSLVHVDNAYDISGATKLLPSLLLPEEVPPELLTQRAPVYPATEGDEEGAGAGGASRPGGSLLEWLGRRVAAAVGPLAPLAAVCRSLLSGPAPAPAAPPLDWHPRRPLLAAADSLGRVTVVEAGALKQLPVNGAGRAEVLALGPSNGAGGGGGQGGVHGAVKWVLEHAALKQQALSLSWCPTSPGLLAVGSSGVVGLWSLGAAEARPPLALAGRATGPWLRLLHTRRPGARVTSLSWSPDGRLLAAASTSQAGLQVWEVSSGIPTRVAAGPAAFDLVRWSPCGNYVFAAGTNSTHFYIFETHHWRWARWQLKDSGAGLAADSAAAMSPPGPPGPMRSSGAGQAGSGSECVVAAAWAPAAPGRTPLLLAAPAGESYLIAVHLVGTPPGLTAQLLPVVLPELQRGRGRSDAGGRSAPPSPAAPVVDMVWDARGERLALLRGAGGPQDAPSIALYGTSIEPLVTASLIGMARPPTALAATAGQAVAAAGGGGQRSGGEAASGSVGRQRAESSGQEADGSAAPRPVDSSAVPENLVTVGFDRERTLAAAAAAGGGAGGAGGGSGVLCALRGALAVARLGSGDGGAVGGAAVSVAQGVVPPAVVISARVGSRGVYNLPCYF